MRRGFLSIPAIMFSKLPLIMLMVLGTSAADAKNRSLEERGELFEGDMRLTEDQKRALDGGNDIVLHNADIDGHWPKNDNNLVEIPYELSHKFTSRQRRAINKAMNEYKKNTCIRFVPKSRNQDYHVRIMMDEPRKCWSDVGYLKRSNRWKRFQEINLGVKDPWGGRGCFNGGIRT